ncbi:MAG: alpha,2-mannosyltransferase [Rubrobacteraceae bacterium]|nr:alpha,2-mannosyltransferase [Rubrobacteraceae bacterium]
MDKTGGFKVLAKVPDAILIVCAFGALVVGLWLSVYFGSAVARGIFSDSMYVHADFDSFWRSAVALWEGRNIYDTGTLWTNLNPPFWTLLISPLGLLEPLTAYRVFVLVTLLMNVGSLVWMAYELRLRLGWAVVGVGMLLLSSPLIDTLRLGQLYPVLALGLVAAWVADRHDKPLLSGCALGLVVAVKPSLAPVLLWPLMRRRWSMLGAALASGTAAMLVGLIVVGPEATLNWLRLLAIVEPAGYWENASLPSAAARFFSENQYVEPIATLPWAVPVAKVLGVGILILTAAKVRRDPEMSFWALVAASLLFSPIAWYRYLVLLGPGILLLFARGSVAPALLLLALQFIPREWFDLWQNAQSAVVALALTLYFYILLAYWFALLPTDTEEPARTSEPERT